MWIKVRALSDNILLLKFVTRLSTSKPVTRLMSTRNLCSDDKEVDNVIKMILIYKAEKPSVRLTC